MSDQPPTDQQIEDAAVTALLRRLERASVDRAVLADMTDQQQVAVFAAEARASKRR
ncbi:hypothetical protein Cme02nite_45260 [Catellatospora methionotrophica]|uniref:Uncharacterized protein n=1 Tax=Catellatospora methionotrophica TaxID=121620 RepID=A0A8J3LIG7_9ACTN|nr:hypothetical protein [Catellatospora methionotrophica]GIG16194.1 hypothetical protein Cme02nite_45260 [Catellatospora methionotrophica]